MTAANAILDDAMCELLASVDPIDQLETLQQLVGSSWSRWDQLGERLFIYMKGLNIPALPHPATRSKKTTAIPHIPANPSTSVLACADYPGPSFRPNTCHTNIDIVIDICCQSSPVDV
ncbi:hypothetical protein K438DRAFT_1993018 [Mycena galopus ATCC 62051]|nr:hypothetical protein K438DRAFT_1993018 [Mycena galopus ATCC 62051]